MQRPAKPWTPVRFRLPPPSHASSLYLGNNTGSRGCRIAPPKVPAEGGFVSVRTTVPTKEREGVTTMRIASVVTALGLAAAAFAMPAAAQNAGKWYIGYSAGQSKYNLNCTGTCSDTGAGWTAFAGVGLHPNVALEFGYGDMGKTTFGPSNV